MLENIEKILNMKKVRWEYMDVKLKDFKKSIPEESTINFFIDVPATIKQLYNPEIIKGISGIVNKHEKYVISALILNMIGHYREYFINNFRCFTNVFFMYNSKIDKYIKDNVDPDYRKTYYEKRFLLENPVYSDLNCLLRDNYKRIATIIDYIPHAYFIDSKDCDYRSIFPYIMDLPEFRNNFNIILTTDTLMYQNTLVGSTIVLEPRAEKTRVIKPDYIIKLIGGKSKILEKNPEYVTIQPENIILLNALVNHKSLDTTGIRNFGYCRAIKFLNDNGIDVESIILNPNSLDDIFKNILTKDEIEKIKINFKIYNNFYLANKYKKSLELAFSLSNKYYDDKMELRKVNETFYKKSPLRLDFMFRGER